MVDTWLPCHLFGMYSAYETPLLGPEKHGIFLEFKKSLLSVFEYIARSGGAESSVFTLAPKDLIWRAGGPLLFFSTGLYLDGNSNTVVAETYVVPMTAITNPRSSILSRFEETRAFDDHHRISRSVSIVEDFTPCNGGKMSRLGTYFVLRICRRSAEEFDPDKSPLCSCGVGKVSKTFIQSRWKDATNFVTRVAISPLFAAPYLETAKGGPLSRNPRIVESGPPLRLVNDQKITGLKDVSYRFRTTSAAMLRTGIRMEMRLRIQSAWNTTPEACVFKCSDCGKDGAKKCGACGEAYYCSRQCQRRDWKKHKAACQKVQAEQTTATAS